MRKNKAAIFFFFIAAQLSVHTAKWAYLSTVMPPQAPKKDAQLNSDLHLSTSPFEFNSLYKAAP